MFTDFTPSALAPTFDDLADVRQLLARLPYGVVNVRGYGAVGDGVTDDTAAILAAILAAELVDATVVFPPGTYLVTTTLPCKRSTRLVGQSAAASVVRWTASSGTLLRFGTAAEPNDRSPGGITDLCLRGAGGAADTSIGLVLGGVGLDAQNMVFERMEIERFGTGLNTVQNSSYMLSINNSTIHDNANDGWLISDTPVQAENLRLINTSLFNNGLLTGRSAICVAGSAELHVTGGSFDNNGTGARGQIYVETGGNLGLDCEGTHFEYSPGVGPNCVPFVESAANGAGGSCTLYLSHCYVVCGQAVARPLITIVNGEVKLVANTFSTPGVVSGLVPVLDLGDAQNLIMRVSGFGNTIAASGNAPYVRTGSTLATLTWLGNKCYNTSASPIIVLGAGTTYVHDETGAVGDLVLGRNLSVGGTLLVSGTSQLTSFAAIGQAPASTTCLGIRAATTTFSQINLAAGVAPTSPVDGDLWYDGTNLKFRVGGTTKTVTLT